MDPDQLASALKQDPNDQDSGQSGILAALINALRGAGSSQAPASADDVPVPASPTDLGLAPTVQSTGGPVQAVTPMGQAIASGVADTLMAPGRAYNGQMAVRDPETGDLTQEATDWGAGTALGMLGGSSVPRAPIAAPGEVALGMFAGRTAKTADLGALAKAQDLAASGAPREQIWGQTGWFQGPDQQWRFEIPDNASQIGTKALEELNATGSSGATQRSAPGVLWHKELYDAYPQMRQIDVDARYNAGLSTENTSGTYMSNPPGNGGRPKIDMQLNAIAGPSGPQPTMLHELQHDIQQREGFALGGDPSRSNGVPIDAQFAAAREAYNASAGDSALLRELGIDVPDAEHPPWDSLTRREQVKWLEAGRSQVYRNLAGEVEARNVETRLPMTPEERRATPPWATQDVPDAQQIVRMGSDGPQMSMGGPIRAYHGSPHDFDAFDLSKIGTGEGNQAYGHGLYFAENPAVAEVYKGVQGLASQNPAANIAAKTMATGGEELTQRRLRQIFPQMSDEDIAAAIRVGQNPPAGKMYEVGIHADPQTFLDWDKPLAEQSRGVQEVVGDMRFGHDAIGDLLAKQQQAQALKASTSDRMGRLSSLSGPEMQQLNADLGTKAQLEAFVRDRSHLLDRSGSAMYGDLGGYRDPAQISSALQQAGIPGIKYLDAGSRGTGAGSSNYVVFNPAIVEILRKYGVASMAALPPAVLMALQNGQTPPDPQT